MPRALLLTTAAALVLGLSACHRTNDKQGTTDAGSIPDNQGMGGVNDGAPGASAGVGNDQPGAVDTGNPAGAQNYPATGRP